MERCSLRLGSHVAGFLLRCWDPPERLSKLRTQPRGSRVVCMDRAIVCVISCALPCPGANNYSYPYFTDEETEAQGS